MARKGGVKGASATQVGFGMGRKFGGSPKAGKSRHGHTHKSHRSHALRP